LQGLVNLKLFFTIYLLLVTFSQVGKFKETSPLMDQTPTPTPTDGAKVLDALLKFGAFAYMGFIFYGGGGSERSRRIDAFH
jgi:hypothetical protein